MKKKKIRKRNRNKTNNYPKMEKINERKEKEKR